MTDLQVCELIGHHWRQWIGSGGTVCIHTSITTHLLTDINGYFPV